MPSQIDYTKTKFYANLDIAMKVVGAIGVVLLGIAGLLYQEFQREAADASRLKDQLSNEAKLANEQHLLTLHGLCQLEFLLADAESAFSERSYTTNEGQLMVEYGSAITASADSLFYPDAPSVSILAKNNEAWMSSARASNSVSVPLVAAGTLAGE